MKFRLTFDQSHVNNVTGYILSYSWTDTSWWRRFITLFILSLSLSLVTKCVCFVGRWSVESSKPEENQCTTVTSTYWRWVCWVYVCVCVCVGGVMRIAAKILVGHPFKNGSRMWCYVLTLYRHTHTRADDIIDSALSSCDSVKVWSKVSEREREEEVTSVTVCDLSCF